MRRVSGWVIGVVLCGAALYALAEDLTLTTYYPSPRGVYKEVRITDRLAVGTTTPTAQVEVVAPAPITAVTTNQTTLAIRIPATTRFNTFDASLTNTAAAITNQAINSSGSNQLTNVGLSVSASGAERNYGLLVPEGQVGIGTTSPSTMLDVNGQVRIRGGSPDTGQVLTATDATGLARWQSPTGTQWKRIAVLNEVVDSIATDDLPAACTTSNGVCSGMLILVRSGSPADQSLLFQYLHSGGGRWHSAFADGQADGSASGGSGVNGDAVPRTIVNATLCTLYDDSGVEMSASKWTLRVSDINYSCEVWVSGF